MKIKPLLPAVLLVCSGAAFAQSPARLDLESVVRKAIPQCPGETKIASEDLPFALPGGFSGKRFKVVNEAPGCSGIWAAVMSPRGNVFVGSPWPLGNLTGAPAERIRQFALEHLEESVHPSVGATRNEDGLLPVELLYNTEFGKVPMRGLVDPSGTLFFPAPFYPAGSDLGRLRLEKISQVLAAAPSRGRPDAPVVVVEFSDFQCPSCKSSSGYMKPILEKFGDSVRYTRVDYPLMSHHPWAFGAAVIGRAIYQQKPEAFWKFKDAVYASQADLNLFTLEEFGRGFAADNELNIEKFNAAIASEEIRKQILESISAAYTLQVAGTPTFLVNGQMVYGGVEGKNLVAVIERALNRPSS